MGRSRQWKAARSTGPDPAGLVLLAPIPLVLALIFIGRAADAAEAAKPSFDCAQAKSVAEKMICADPALAVADAAIAANYAAALKRLDAPARKALSQDQQDFVSY